MRILTRYRDVAAALRDPSLAPVGGEVGPADHRAMRDLARRLYPVAKLAALPIDVPAGALELVADFAAPYGMGVAALMTDIPLAKAHSLRAPAQAVFDTASPEAAAELAAQFPRVAALHTQAFVALATSLPAFLGNAWLALLQNREQWQWLGEPTAIDELLRFAGPSLLQMRVGVELHLAAANRDASVFPDPDRLDLRRDARGHLAFGAGSHACVGASLVKAATAAILPVFAARFSDAQLLRAEPFGTRLIRGHRVYVL